ncbi:glutamate carboxypeptidase [Frigoribacterium sp. PhB160]|uniref:M20/M25/M40 family metallo-hydrolase n=1 Tax=Frigoribacterium sp. PhB160 TaxID=2485192 RepID=UPI000FB7D00D|nr:M20/M25/M40 family metallo-hydrolase [Frigoribacterium sp. PhB160]ROS61011.1 glutamate carboxypeptidase [Frigoribacterium sp. PhB160]
MTLSPTDRAAMRTAVEARRDAMVDDLVTYASLETPSDDVDLLEVGLAWIEAFLGRTAGPAADRRVRVVEGYGDTVALDFPSPTGSAEWVTALCHYDTVWAEGTLAEWPVTIEGDRMTGPGVFDMKSGLVQLGHALAVSDALGLPRPGVRLLLNGDEEVGSIASRPSIEEEVGRGGAVLVFESAAEGAVKTARKGVGIFEVQAFGVEVHAGLYPRAGASAVDEMARLVLQLHGEADIDAGTSINVGIVQGGTRTNVRAGHARAMVDVRVTTADEAARVERLFASLTAHDPLARVEVTGGWNRPVMERSPQTGALYERAARVASDLGFELREVSVGGASDGNFAAALGAAVLDGVGGVGGGAHARHEWISLDGMVERTEFVTALFAELA